MIPRIYWIPVVICIAVANLAFIGGVVYVTYHYVSKYW